MAGPWEKYAKPAAKPWEKYAAQKAKTEGFTYPRDGATPMKGKVIDLTAEAQPGNIGHAFSEGATLGFGDEIRAGVFSLPALADPDQSFSDAYDENLMKERAQLENYKEANPKKALAAEVGGAIASPGLAIGAAARTGMALQRALKASMAAGTGGAAYGFGSAQGNERLSNALKTGVLSAGVGAAGPLVISPIAKALMERSASKKALRNAPTPDELRQSASALFKEADEVKGLDRSVLTNSAGDIMQRAERQGMDGVLTPQADRAANRLMDAATDAKPDIGFRELDVLRRQAQVPASNAANRVESSIGSGLVDDIDKIIAEASPKLGSKVEEARKTWGKLRRTELIEEAVSKAGNAASGFENGLRVQFRSILNDPKKRKGFSPTEITAMEKVVQDNRFAQRVGGWLRGFGSAGGAAAGGIEMGAATYLGGKVVEGMLTRAAKKNADKLQKLVASGDTDAMQAAFDAQLKIEGAIRRSAMGTEQVNLPHISPQTQTAGAR